MSDDINTDAIAIVSRLKAADLFTLAERAAKRVELRLADCISFGDVTGGHVALWRALAKEVPVTRVAAILGWQADTIARELRVPEARPTPAPVSEVRVKAKPAVKAKGAAPKPAAPPVPTFTITEVKALIEAAVAPLRARVSVLEKSIADLSWEWNADTRAKETVAIDYLARFGRVGEVVRTVAKEHGVPLDILLSRGRTPLVTGARGEIVRQLTTGNFGLTQQEIATVLKLDHSSVHSLQQKAGVLPARSPNGRPRAA